MGDSTFSITNYITALSNIYVGWYAGAMLSAIGGHYEDFHFPSCGSAVYIYHCWWIAGTLSFLWVRAGCSKERDKGGSER